MKRKLSFLLVLCSLASFCFAITEKFTHGNYNIIYAPINLVDNDFLGSNFFVRNTIGGKDMNVEIFHQLKAMVESGAKTGEVDKDIKKKLKKKQGELAMTPYIANDGKIWYSVYDKQKNNFVTYEFQLEADKDANALYEEYSKQYDQYATKIAECNKTIEICSSPTIKQWKTKQVPYQAQVAYTVDVPYEAEVAYEVSVPYEEYEYVRDWTPNGSTSSGSVDYVQVPVTRYRTEIRYRTETRYRKETRYRTETKYRNESESFEVPNSQYDPKKVAKAKEELNQLQIARAGIEAKIQDRLPCD